MTVDSKGDFSNPAFTTKTKAMYKLSVGGLGG